MSATGLGPYYNFADEMKYPSELDIKRDGSVERGSAQIERNVAGIQYYVDAMAYGNPTKSVPGYGRVNYIDQQPMGLRYFFNTGQQCSNGADMYQYMTTITQGMPMGMGNGLEKLLGNKLQGLAPGVLQDSFDAMNPLPIFTAAMGTGYPKCKLMEAPVGDANGEIKSRFQKPVFNQNPTGADDPPIMVPNIWVDPATDKAYKKNGKWVLNRWVFDKWITQDEFYWTQSQLKKMGRLYRPGDVPDQNTKPDPRIPPQPSANEQKASIQDKSTEGFSSNLDSSQVGAGILFAMLFAGLVAFTSLRK